MPELKLKDMAYAVARQQIVDPLGCYAPHRKQREAHELLNHKLLFLCGNGAGKSFWGAHEFSMAMTGRHWVDFNARKGLNPPKYYKTFVENGEQVHKFSPLDGRICAELSAVTKVIIPMLQDLLKPYLAEGYPQKGGKTYYSIWKLKNGSSFDILVYDMEDKAFESVSKDIVWFDEPFRESIYYATTARMRSGKGGHLLFTLTPLMSAAWMYERFVTEAEDDDIERPALVYAEIWDNCKCLTPDEHDNNQDFFEYHDIEGQCRCNGGYVHRKAIDLMMAEWDEEERDAREKGVFAVISDLVFRGFDANSHILNEEITPDDVRERGLQLYVVCDPHPRRPPAWGLYGFDEDNILYILDEFPNYFTGMYKDVYYDRIKDYKLGYDTTVKIFHTIEEKWGEIRRRFIDPRHGSSRLPNTGKMVMDEYRDYAVECGFDMKFYKALVGSDSMEGEIVSGLLLIKQRLMYNKEIKLGAGNMPGVFANPTCTNHIRMFQFFKYKTITGKQAEDRLPSVQFSEKHKDWADLLRYLLKSVKGYMRKEPLVTVNYKYKPLNMVTGY